MLGRALLATLVAGSAASFVKIAGYQPNSGVFDHNYVDMDQKFLEDYFPSASADTPGTEDYSDVENMYTKGAHSKPYTTFTFAATTTLANTHAAGAQCKGKNAAGDDVIGTLKSEVAAGDGGTIECLYAVAEAYPTGSCYVGGLKAADQTTTGCLVASADITLGSGDDAETIAGDGELTLVESKGGRTLYGFGKSSTTTDKMWTNSASCPGCPYKTYTAYYKYYGTHSYMDEFVQGAIDGTKVEYDSHGTAKYAKIADFSVYNKLATRKDSIKKATAYWHVWMYTIREFEDAIDDCSVGSLDLNYGSVHAWDEGVAFYTGSLEGVDGSGSGKMIYNLADKRCENFGTCMGTTVAPTDYTKGTSHVNNDLLDQFQKGRNYLMVLNCAAVRPIVDKVISLMTVPLVQGTLRYAYKVSTNGPGGADTLTKLGAEGAKDAIGGLKEMAEGTTFAFGILPLINECSPAAAKVVYDNMHLGAINTCDKDAVKAALQSVYPCLGITCAQVGALTVGGGCNEDDAWCTVCSDGVPPTETAFGLIAGYRPRSKVTDHNALDLDQKALESALPDSTAAGPWSYVDAKSIYESGGHSKAYATLTIAMVDNKGVDITDEHPAFTAGTSVTGVSASGTLMISGTVKSDSAAGSGTVDVLYDTTLVQATYNGPCAVGGLPTAAQTLTGCIGEDTTVVIGWTSVKATAVVGKAGRTLKGFGTTATTTAKMYTDCAGCPYKTYSAYYNYYGTHNYMDDFVQGAIAGTKVEYTGADGGSRVADFETYNRPSTRVDAIKKGTAYWHVWMYTIREFEDAIDDCKTGQIDNNYDAAHAWDEGVAFYTGSLEGVDGSGSGKMLYNLADKRCANFATCMGTTVAPTDYTKGLSHVNNELFAQFDVAQSYLYYGQCTPVRPVLTKVISLMTVPLVQGTLRYAYKVSTNGPGGADTLTKLGPEGDKDAIGGMKEMAEGTTFAFGILPLIHECDASAAQVVYDNMHLGALEAGCDKDAVKDALESVYPCLGITCAQVGALTVDGGCTEGDAWCVVCTDAVPVEITSTFTIPGNVADVTDAQKTSMAAVIASEAGVATDAVELSFAAGSVVVTVTITVPESQAAAKSTALETGIFADSAALQSAFEAGGVTGITVEEMTYTGTATTVVVEELSTGALAGIIVGAVLAVVFLLCLCVLIQKEKAGTPVFTSIASPRNKNTAV